MTSLTNTASRPSAARRDVSSLWPRAAAATIGLAGAAAAVAGVRETWLSTFAGLLSQSGWGTRNGTILVVVAAVAAAVAVVQLIWPSLVLRWALAVAGLAI